MYSNLLHSDAALYIVIGLLIFNYMLFKNQRNNLKKFIIVFLFSNIWGGINLYSMYKHINGIEKIVSILWYIESNSALINVNYFNYLSFYYNDTASILCDLFDYIILYYGKNNI